MTSLAYQAAGGARPAQSLAPDAYRAVMRHHAKGVAVITAGGERPAGFCATSVASISLDPPLVSFAAGLATTSWAAMRGAPHYLVHLLAEGQEEVARVFARSGADRFGAGVAWRAGPYGLPLLDGVLAWLVLEPVAVHPVGDHALVVGRVVAAAGSAGGRPLVHHAGEFTGLG